MARIAHFSHVVHRNWPLAFLQAGILAVFALLPLWDRFSHRAPPPLFLPGFHVSYFFILLPVLWTIVWWLVLRLPGFAGLLRDPLRRIWALALLLLGLWAVASLSWAFMRLEEPEVGQNAALQLALVVLFAVVVACAGPPARAVVAALVLALVVNSAVTVGQALFQRSLGLELFGEFPIGPDVPGVSILRAGHLRWIRPVGLMPHPNMLAGTLVIGLLAAAALVVSPRRVLRWMGSAVFALGFWALLLTFSRGAWLGFLMGSLAVLPLLRPHLRRLEVRSHLAITLGIVLAVGLLFLVAYAPFLSARAGEGSESVELRSISDRLVFMDFAVRSIAERPVIGVGIGNFPWRTSYFLADTDFDLRGDNVHHVFLSAWAELGVVGLVLLVAALVAGLEAALRAFKTSPAARSDSGAATWLTERAAGIGLLAAVIALIAIGILDHYPWTTFHFQLAWWGTLALASRGPQARPLARAASQASRDFV